MEKNSQQHQSTLTQNSPNILHMKVGDVILIQVRAIAIDPNWCLTKNQSTCNTFMKKNYLVNIRKEPNLKVLHVHCNLGTTVADMVGYLPNYDDPIWYNPYEIANIFL